MTVVGGAEALSSLLNKLDRSTEDTIMEYLSKTDPEIADEVRRMMFVFEDLIQVDDRGMQNVLKEVRT